jgi:hypothetical protein
MPMATAAITAASPAAPAATPNPPPPAAAAAPAPPSLLVSWANVAEGNANAAATNNTIERDATFLFEPVPFISDLTLYF